MSYEMESVVIIKLLSHAMITLSSRLATMHIIWLFVVYNVGKMFSCFYIFINCCYAFEFV